MMRSIGKIVSFCVRRCCWCLLFALPLFPTPSYCQESGYVEQVVAEADRLKLHEERTWKALLHYGKTFSGKYKSKIDDPNFFLSAQGRTDSKAELESTVRSFFQVDSGDGKNSVCRFPARFAWLDQRLQFDHSQLPASICSERDTSIGKIDATSAVLIFPVGHINSPASMFGHTLIRIDGSSKSTLISHAVNYAAYDTDTNGILYAWKGLTGMYKAYYSLMPYYDKVREYNDLEHRDMWEYRLNLTEPEVKRMLDHIWELQKIESSYYFFDENCSYNLLFLIEVARPELQLTDKSGIFVVPADTVRTVMESGIIGEVKYRPSQGTKIRNMLSLLNPAGQEIAADISMQNLASAQLEQRNVPATEKIKILDLASDFVQFRYSRKEMAKDDYSRLYLNILKERSKLGAAPEDLYRIEEPSRPESGHGTTRISLASGVHRGELFGEINVRPEFHALLDPDQGYLPGAQIKFLDTSVRYDADSGYLYLKSLYLLDIFSISPRDTFFKPVSWKINTGFTREVLSDRQEHLVSRLNGGGGFSYRSPFGGIWYLMGEFDINAGPGIRAGVTAAPGCSVGAVEQLTRSTKILLNASGFWYGVGDDRRSVKTSVGLNQRITQDNSLSLETSLDYVNSTPISEVALRWNYYY